MGGPQRRFIQIANAFSPRYRHAIIAMDGRIDAVSQLSSDVTVDVLPVPLAKAGGLSVQNLKRIAATIRQQQPDLMLAYNWGAIEWTLVNRLMRLVPQLHFEDGFGPEEADGHQIARRVWTRQARGHWWPM